MKKTRFVAIVLIITMIVVSFCGCGSSKTLVIDTGITNNISYNDYSFWETENELWLYTNYSVKKEDISEKGKFTELGDTELSEKYQKQVEKLRDGIIEYFSNNYEINLKDKIAKQEVKVFSVKDQKYGMTMGYVNKDYPNVLNLNKVLFTDEYKYLFNNTYVHETLHQLGIMDVEDSNNMLYEGITDAFTDLILCNMGLESNITPIYSESRTLAYQLIKADSELPHLFFEVEGFSLSDRISEKLEEVKRPQEKCSDPGQDLVTLLSILYNNNIGTLQCKTDPYWYAYDAQSIVYSYCRTFNLDHEKIDYIRSHYLVTDFEESV